MATKQCLNCFTPFLENDKFCRQCGQSVKVKRLTLKEWKKNALKKFLHADSGILFLTRELAIRPGLVAKEYVEGKRKKYYAPLNYLTLAAAISFFLVAYFHLMDQVPNQQNPGSAIAAKYFNLIILASVPISAFFSLLLFRNKGYNLAEILVLQAYLGGFRTVFFIFIFTPLVVLFRQQYFLILALYLGIWVIYSAWAKNQFFGGPTWLTVLKSVLVILLNQIVITIAISAIIFFQLNSAN